MRLPRLSRFLLNLSFAIATLALASCASGPHKDVFPPRASIQQLTVQADGSWKLQVRMQNFSGVSMTFANVDGKLEVAGNPAGDVNAVPALRIGPESADIAEVTFKPTPAAAQAVAALHGSGSVRYKLSGRIVTTDPAGDQPYTFEGALNPVPGLTGVLR